MAGAASEDAYETHISFGLDSTSKNWMTFQIYNIRGLVGASGSDVSFVPAVGTGGVTTVTLPIPTAPQVTYEQGWDNQESNKGADILRQFAVGASDNANQNLNGAWQELIDSGKALSNLGFVGAIGALLDDQVTTQGASGMAVFNQTYATYAGPGFRTFNYNFSLKPKNVGEVRDVDSIVRFFKINSAPRSYSQAVARVYGLPKAFKIRYYNGGGGESPWINKVGMSALTSIGVSYGGDRFTTFERTNSPVQIDLSLTFRELQLQDEQSIAAGY